MKRLEDWTVYGLCAVPAAAGGYAIWAGVDRWLWPQPGYFYPLHGWGEILLGAFYIAIALLGLVAAQA